MGASGDLTGYLKSNYRCNNGKGESSFELSTDAARESKANLKFFNLARGLIVNLTTSTKDKNFKRPVAGVEFEYTHANVAATASLKSDSDVHQVDSSLSIGSDGLSVGGRVLVDVTRGADVIDTAFGGEYSTSDFTVSTYSESNMGVLKAGYHQRINADHTVGALFAYQLGKQERSLTVGNEYRVDAATTVKSKIELPTGNLFTSVEHRLANPALLLTVAAQFNAKSQSFAADKLGVQVTMGDF